MTQTATKTATYTVADIEKVVTRVRADLMMIGDSTGAWTPEQSRNYASDVEELAKAGYLNSVDVTLLSGGQEVHAAKFVISTDASSWTSSRPGGVRWPRLANPRLRIILFHAPNYDEAAEKLMESKLKVNWTPTSEDTSHVGLSSQSGRDYASNSFGIQRLDWAA
jgi:Bacterial HORMA domain family 1